MMLTVEFLIIIWSIFGLVFFSKAYNRNAIRDSDILYYGPIIFSLLLYCIIIISIMYPFELINKLVDKRNNIEKNEENKNIVDW